MPGAPGTPGSAAVVKVESAAARIKWEPDAKTLGLVKRKRSFRVACETFPYFEADSAALAEIERYSDKYTKTGKPANPPVWDKGWALPIAELKVKLRQKKQRLDRASQASAGDDGDGPKTVTFAQEMQSIQELLPMDDGEPLEDVDGKPKKAEGDEDDEEPVELEDDDDDEDVAGDYAESYFDNGEGDEDDAAGDEEDY